VYYELIKDETHTGPQAACPLLAGVCMFAIMREEFAGIESMTIRLQKVLLSLFMVYSLFDILKSGAAIWKILKRTM